MLATTRDIESLRELSERCGDQVKLFELDVTDESSAAGAVKTAIDAFGSLDVVIHHAGLVQAFNGTSIWICPVVTAKSKAIRHPRRYVAHGRCRVDRLFFKRRIENVDVINVSR